jgi:hypothetical protein
VAGFHGRWKLASRREGSFYLSLDKKITSAKISIERFKARRRQRCALIPGKCRYGTTKAASRLQGFGYGGPVGRATVVGYSCECLQCRVNPGAFLLQLLNNACKFVHARD